MRVSHQPSTHMHIVLPSPHMILFSVHKHTSIKSFKRLLSIWLSSLVSVTRDAPTSQISLRQVLKRKKSTSHSSHSGCIFARPSSFSLILWFLFISSCFFVFFFSPLPLPPLHQDNWRQHNCKVEWRGPVTWRHFCTLWPSLTRQTPEEA